MNNEYQNMFQQAINLFYQGEIDRAEDICRKLINVSSKEPDVFNILLTLRIKKVERRPRVFDGKIRDKLL